MKVCDYVHDMTLEQTFVIDVEVVSIYEDHEVIKYVAYPFKIPFGHCKFLDFPVRYIRVVDGFLTLYVTEYVNCFLDSVDDVSL